MSAGSHWNEPTEVGYDIGMNIKTLLVASLTVVVALSLWIGTAVAAAAQNSPNVVVFLVDDMGVMDTSVPFLTDEKGQQLLCHERLFADSDFDHDRSKCGQAPCDQLDQSAEG